MTYCKECGAHLKWKKDRWPCMACHKPCCAKHIYSRVDESNRSITLNAPNLCRDCYQERYQ